MGNASHDRTRVYWSLAIQRYRLLEWELMILILQGPSWPKVEIGNLEVVLRDIQLVVPTKIS